MLGCQLCSSVVVVSRRMSRRRLLPPHLGTVAPSRRSRASTALPLLPARIRVPAVRCHRPFSSASFLHEWNNDEEGGGKAAKRKKKKDERNKKSAKPSYRFVDRTRVRVSGGDGGKGNLSMNRIGRGFKLRPDGGHGGHGGHVFVVADPKEQTLKWSHPHVVAEQGANGSGQDKLGRNGRNKVVRVPCGVIVRRILDYDEVWDYEKKLVIKNEVEEAADDTKDDADNYIFQDDMWVYQGDTSNEGGGGWDTETGLYSEDDEEGNFGGEMQKRETVVLADLDRSGAHVLIAEGGKGGTGSCQYKTSNERLPDQTFMQRKAQPTNGERVFLELELKLIADIGLVGYPNAGKSSLLTAMSKAAPEIAPYPFTTLHPLLGTIEYGDGYKIKAADVPGLIDGASEGKGMGLDFLRHLERTKALLFIVDAAGVDGRDPIRDLEVLVKELSAYGEGDMLTNRLALVVANKMDLLDEQAQHEILRQLELTAEEMGLNVHGKVLGISAGVTGVGLAHLSKSMRSVVTHSKVDLAFLEEGGG